MHCVDAHSSTEENQNNHQGHKAAKIEVVQMDLDWQNKGELFLAWWAHETLGREGRDALSKWARDQGVDLIMDTTTHVIHDCDICATIKPSK